ncbi:unnamed protein product [Amoebophrya sp. A25]|nr:unnamed protein product [Amoebophrya sp. A25]|eukprot:GSA25T00013082001.1
MKGLPVKATTPSSPAARKTTIKHKVKRKQKNVEASVGARTEAGKKASGRPKKSNTSAAVVDVMHLEKTKTGLHKASKNGPKSDSSSSSSPSAAAVAAVLPVDIEQHLTSADKQPPQAPLLKVKVVDEAFINKVAERCSRCTQKDLDYLLSLRSISPLRGEEGSSVLSLVARSANRMQATVADSVLWNLLNTIRNDYRQTGKADRGGLFNRVRRGSLFLEQEAESSKTGGNAEHTETTSSTSKIQKKSTSDEPCTAMRMLRLLSENGGHIGRCGERHLLLVLAPVLADLVHARDQLFSTVGLKIIGRSDHEQHGGKKYEEDDKATATKHVIELDRDLSSKVVIDDYEKWRLALFHMRQCRILLAMGGDPKVRREQIERALGGQVDDSENSGFLEEVDRQVVLESARWVDGVAFELLRRCLLARTHSFLRRIQKLLGALLVSNPALLPTVQAVQQGAYARPRDERWLRRRLLLIAWTRGQQSIESANTSNEKTSNRDTLLVPSLRRLPGELLKHVLDFI